MSNIIHEVTPTSVFQLSYCTCVWDWNVNIYYISMDYIATTSCVSNLTTSLHHCGPSMESHTEYKCTVPPDSGLTHIVSCYSSRNSEAHGQLYNTPYYTYSRFMSSRWHLIPWKNSRSADVLGPMKSKTNVSWLIHGYVFHIKFYNNTFAIKKEIPEHIAKAVHVESPRLPNRLHELG